jgi:hypothetical protein
LVCYTKEKNADWVYLEIRFLGISELEEEEQKAGRS